MNWIEGKIETIGAIGADFGSEFAGLSTDAMNAKPDADTWSMNECLDHIIQSNRRYYAMFDAVAAGNYQEGRWARFPILPRLMGKMVMKAVSPGYKGKSKTFPIFYPLKSKYEKNLTGDLLNENKVLIDKVRKFKTEELEKIILSSPVNGFITYTLRDCISLLVDHERRHFNQARRVKSGSAA